MKPRHKASLLTATRKLENIFRKPMKTCQPNPQSCILNQNRNCDVGNNLRSNIVANLQNNLENTSQQNVLIKLVGLVIFNEKTHLLSILTTLIK